MPDARFRGNLVGIIQIGPFMPHDDPQELPEREAHAAEEMTDEGWADAIERDVKERFGDMMEQAEWVQVGDAGW